MKYLMKIELLILFLLCSLFVYLDYSFNNFNHYLNDAFKVSYTIEDTYDNEDIIKEISDIADQYEADVYYLPEGINKNLYKFTNEEVVYQDNKFPDKEIKYPNSYRKITIAPISKASDYNLNRGTLVLNEDTNINNEILSKIKGMTINETKIIDLENSEYLYIFIPIIILLFLTLVISIVSKIKMEMKKIGVLYLEGNSKEDIITKYLKNFAYESLFILVCIVILYIGVMYIFQNEGYFLNYLKTLLPVWALYIVLAFIVLHFSIREFKISNLKGLVDSRIALYALYIIKFCLLLVIGSLITNTGNYAHKYQEQLEQQKYNAQIDAYYGYDVKDDGFFDELSTGNINDSYTALYEQTADQNSGLITTSFTCMIGAGDCSEENSVIISPSYLTMYGIDSTEYADDKIYVYAFSNQNVSVTEVANEYNLDEEEIQKTNIDATSIPVISQDYQIKNEKFKYAIVLNQELIQKSSLISDNMFYIMQNYYVKGPESELNKFKEVVKSLGLSEQIRDLYKITDAKNDDINTLQKRIHRQFILFSLVTCALIINLYIINKFILLLATKKTSILVLEGYEFTEVFAVNTKLNLAIYMASAFIAIFYAKTTFDYSNIIKVVSYLLLYILEWAIFMRIYKQKITGAVNMLLKGDVW